MHGPGLLSVLCSCPFLPAQPTCLYLARRYEFQMLLFNSEGGGGDTDTDTGGEVSNPAAWGFGEGGGRGGVGVEPRDGVSRRGAGGGRGLSSSLQHTYRKS